MISELGLFFLMLAYIPLLFPSLPPLFFVYDEMGFECVSA